jgi:hypothetical protein
VCVCVCSCGAILHLILKSRHASSSSSSIGATTLGGFWPALRFRSTIFYVSFSLSSSLSPLLFGQAISVLVFVLVLMSMVPIQLLFLTILVVSVLITCAAHHNICDFVNLTIFFSQLEFLILHLFLSSMFHHCLMLVRIFF